MASHFKHLGELYQTCLFGYQRSLLIDLLSPLVPSEVAEGREGSFCEIGGMALAESSRAPE